MFHFFVRIVFIFGFILGIVFAILLSLLQQKAAKSSITITKYINHSASLIHLYETWFKQLNLKRTGLPLDLIRYSGNNYLTESQYLFNNVKVLCAILVRNLKYAQYANRTWAKQCNDVIFINLELENKRIPTIKKTKDNATWVLLCKALHNFSNLHNWILVVNDNTFVVVDNIRYLVAALNSTKRYYLGHAMKFWNTVYNSGQAGYLLSNGTLNAFKNELQDVKFCKADTTFRNLEDYYLGKMLANLNISPSDTRDTVGLSTFHGFNLQKLFFPGSTILSNYYKYSIYPTKCCSPYSVTFQVEDSDKMFTFDYFIHQLQIFRDGNLGNRVAVTPKPETVWRSFLLERGINNTNITAEQYYNVWKDFIGDKFEFFPH